jgi:hypothetical protein
VRPAFCVAAIGIAGCSAVLGIPASESPVEYHAMGDASRWTSFDASSATGTVVTAGGTFDGRYLYIVPVEDGSGSPTGRVGRYDTRGPFLLPASWSAFDAAALDARARSFVGATFDGRYVYLAPSSIGGTSPAPVVRYDARADFANAGSWTALDPSSLGVVGGAIAGATFDGRYVYLVPFGDFGDAIAVRYDTTQSFDAGGAWSTFDTMTIPGVTPGFGGGIFDGRYVYFTPFSTGGGYHGVVARHDTRGTFADPGAWSVFDLQSVNPGAAGFRGAAFDGRFVYFAPGVQSVSTAARYDTRAAFGDAASWAFFDTSTLNPGARGFSGAGFDGRYVYFAPYQNVEGIADGLVVRVDTTFSFVSAAAWSTFDTSTLTPSAGGFSGMAFDGRYMYLLAGSVARFDAKAPALLPSLPGFYGEF